MKKKSLDDFRVKPGKVTYLLVVDSEQVQRIQDSIASTVYSAIDKRRKEELAYDETCGCKMLSRFDVMGLLDISEATLWRYEKAEKLKSVSVGSRKLFPLSEVQKLISDMRSSKSNPTVQN